MDLRWRLATRLSLLAAALLAAGCAMVALALTRDVSEEVAASGRLAELLLGIGEAGGGQTAALKRLLEAGELRHVAVSLERPGLEQSRRSGAADPLDWLAARLPGGATDEQRIAIGDEVLVIRADPRAEIREVLRDGLRMLGVLALFACVTVFATWRAAHRALAPVRELEQGLARLARGEEQAALPRFELQEFDRIAAAVDRLAASLAAARAAETTLARRLIGVQEAERRELARELHDEFGQSLAAIGAATAFIERHAGTADAAGITDCARDARTEAARMSSHVRGLLRQLRPHGLGGLGMRDALAELVQHWRARAGGIALDVELPGRLPRLAPEAGLALYRCLQESLTNVLRHSGAGRAAVRLQAVPGGVRLVVGDDGCGQADSLRAGGGLLGMRERAEMAGGRLSLGQSALGGLQLELWLPEADEGARVEDEVDEGDLHDDPHPVAR
ncbi:sensor histidine kinase [Thauera sinica]|uniref:Sensor histidine kinase n=2 Tax=Zoogloeaceae TaxID=2008794 RepID=A0ABW1AUG3_9RHOO